MIDSFIPPKESDELTFVLEGVFKRVPTDFSININTKKLKSKPVSFEYEGNYISIKEVKKHNNYSMRESIIPIEKETTVQIVMEGGRDATASELLDWVVVDQQGNAYETNGGSHILDEKDENNRYKTEITLDVSGLDEVPEEFTLHLISVTRYEKLKETWEVPLY